MTTSLPRGFGAESESIQEIEPIGAERREQSARRGRAGGVSSGTTVALAVLVSLLTVVATMFMLSTEEQRAEAMGKFGVTSQFTSDNTRQDTEISELKAQLAQQSDAISTMSAANDSIRREIKAVDANAISAVGGVVERVASLEARAEILSQQLEQANTLAAELSKPKPTPVAAPGNADRPQVRQRVEPVTLVSVRSQGGALAVSLRLGADSSGLMVLGDTWRGWKLIDADPGARAATFEVGGQVRELML